MKQDGGYDEIFNQDNHKDAIASRKGGQSFKGNEGGKAYNIGYILALFMCMSIGTIQFGFSIGSWNTEREAAPTSQIKKELTSDKMMDCPNCINYQKILDGMRQAQLDEVNEITREMK